MARESVLILPKFHPKQKLVWESTASEILFAGDTRAGKSYFVRRAYIVWCSQIPGLQCDIFRLHFDDVINENMDGETSFPVLLNQWQKDGLCKINQTEIVFWNESKISLEHCSDDLVLLKHRGIAKHVRTFGESTQILEHRIRALTGWVTMSEDMKSRVPEKWKGQFPKVFHVTNPDGISSGYYRRNFVDCCAPYTIRKVGQFQRQYIPAFLDDNPSENAEATKARIGEAFQDKAIQEALIATDKTGVTNWHTGGGEFFTEWDLDRHVTPDFTPPHWWFRYRSMDIGWHEPTAIYWIAVSDGQAFKDHDGNERWYPRGSRIFYNEWYICNQEKPALGLQLSNEEIAKGILERTEHASKKAPTLTDSKPFQGTGGQTPAMEFQKHGVILTQVNTGPGSRVAGWSIMRSALIGKMIDGFREKLPMVYFCECCKHAIDYIPALPRHPSEGKKDDAAEHGEATHACDCFPAGTLVTTPEGLKPIETMNVNDRVLTRRGFKPVDSVFSVGIRPTFKVKFSNDMELVGTGTHKIWANNEFTPISNLRYGDIVQTCPHTPTNLDGSLAISGAKRSGQSLRNFISTIKTAIRKITQLKTLCAYQLRIMHDYIWKSLSEKFGNVSLVANPMSLSGAIIGGNTAPINVNRHCGEILESMTRKGSVKNVVNYLRSINTKSKSIVPESVLITDNTNGRLDEYPARNVSESLTQGQLIPSFAQPHVVSVTADIDQKVYNLTISECHEYFANGILVSNSIRYGLIGHEVIKDNVHEITSEMVQKTIKSGKPTIKKITRSMGNAYFN